MDYKRYYQECKSIYDGEWNGAEPLDSLTIRTSKEDGFVPDNYDRYISNISDYVYKKYETKSDLFGLDHPNIVRLDNYKDCDEIVSLGNHFGKWLEENTYNSPCIVEAVLIYKNLANKVERSSWIWHYDNNIREQLKLMVYLSDVGENNGAFEVIMKDGKGARPLTLTNDSRVSQSDILKYEEMGWKRTPIVGKRGTLCLFDPNCVHRATTPTEEPHRIAIVYNFRPYHQNVDKRVDKSWTRTWSNLGNIKKY